MEVILGIIVIVTLVNYAINRRNHKAIQKQGEKVDTLIQDIEELKDNSRK